MLLSRAALPLSIWLLSTLLPACSEGEDEPDLEGRQFLLESAEGFELVEGTRIRLSFRANSELSLYADCNTQSGSFEVTDGALVLNGLGGTQIGCPEALHAQDEWLATFIMSRPRFTLEGDRLTLRSDRATLVFLDREVADPDRPLTGQLWQVDTFIEGDAASTVPFPGGPPTILFTDDGHVTVQTTCSGGEGRYSVAGNQLTLEELGYSEEVCSANTMFVDRQVKAVMNDGTLSFEIEAARLTLRRGSQGLSATLARP